DANLAAQRVHAAGDDIHADAATGVHRYFFLRREAWTEDQRHRGARIHSRRFVRGDDLFTHGCRLELIGRNPRAVVFEDQLIAVAGFLELHLDRADLALGMGSTHVRGLDAMDCGVAEHLDHAVLHGVDVGAGDLSKTRDAQLEAL